MKACFVAFASLALASVGCSFDAAEPGVAGPGPASTSVDEAPRAPGSEASAARDDRGSLATTGGIVGDRAPSAFVCRKGAFCDDFEVGKLGSRWSYLVEEGAGRARLVADSATPGTGALEIWTRDENARAFLVHGRTEVHGAWSGVMGFALRVDSVPSRALGGPELTIKTTKDGIVTLGVALRPEGLVFEQRATEQCSSERCTSRSWVIAPAKEGHWYDVRIGVETATNDIPPYGRVEVAVDGGAIMTGDLSVPFYEGAIVLHAGVTQGDTRPARAELDDVTLLVR